jgi:hypothetical protein
MEGAYRVKLMPSAEQAYRSLRNRARVTPSDPASSLVLESTTEHFQRVNEILRSLMKPTDVFLDQSLLEGMNWLLTRSIDSTLLYYLRIKEERRVSVLHITQFDNTNAYARFWAFLNEGGCEILSNLGVDLPIGYVGPSAAVQ